MPEEFGISEKQVEEIISHLKQFKKFSLKRRRKFKFLCPLCSNERRVSYFPEPQPWHYLQLLIFTLVVIVFFYPMFGYKGFFLFAPFWAIFEVIYRLKKRSAMICPYCGFDIYLYKRDTKLAKQRVQEFWEQKKAEKSKPEKTVVETDKEEKSE